MAISPTMLIRKTSGTEAPAKAAISPVVKNRLKAGATWARPGISTPSSPISPRGSVAPAGRGVVAVLVPANESASPPAAPTGPLFMDISHPFRGGGRNRQRRC